MTDRCRQRSEMTPAALQPLAERACPHVQLSRPSRDAHGASIQRNVPCITRVLSLFQPSGPFTVSRFVAFRVVDALQRVTGWAFAKFSEELRKIASPFIGHRNTTTTVSGIAWIARVVASRFCISPSLMRSRPRSAMRSTQVANPFNLQASAACSQALSYLHAGCNYLSAAIASEQPPCVFAALGWHASNSSQAPEAAVSHVDSNRLHNAIIHVSLTELTP